MMYSLQKIGGIYRLKDWLHFLGIPVLGYFFFNGHAISQLVLSLLVSFFYLSYAYVLNNWTDRFLDANTNKNHFIQEKAQKEQLIGLLLPPFSLTLISSALTSYHTLALMIATIIIASIYSVPPFRIKKYAIIGGTINIAIFLPLFFLTIPHKIAMNVFTPKTIIMILIIALIVYIMELLQEMEGIPEDRQEKIKTIPIIYGEKTCIYLIKIALIIETGLIVTLKKYYSDTIYMFLFIGFINSIIFFQINRLTPTSSTKTISTVRLISRYLFCLSCIILLTIIIQNTEPITQ